MKDEDHSKDAIESIEKTMEDIDFIIAKGTTKNPIFYEETWDQLKCIKDGLENQLS